MNVHPPDPAEDPPLVPSSNPHGGGRNQSVRLIKHDVLL
jgi:hypothetical protein